MTINLTSRLVTHLNELDDAIAVGDLRRIRNLISVAEDTMASDMRNLSFSDLRGMTAYVVGRLQQAHETVCVGYSELLDQLFDAANTHIGSRSDLYREFADSISPQTDLNLPWERIRLRSNGVAVLYNFVPFADTGASVASKRLRELGRKVDVISCSSIGKRSIDSTPYRISRPYIRQAHTLPVGPAWASWEPQYSFIEAALEYIRRAEHNGTEYDFIYTRAMWVPSHYVGALRKIENPDIEWIAEFSDPLSLDVEGLPRAEHPPKDHPVFDGLIARIEEQFDSIPEAERGIFRIAELIVYAFADRIVFTNDLQKLTMLEHINDEKLRKRVIERAEVSNHPTLPREYYTASTPDLELDPEVINIGYFGQFYATRGLGDVTRALNMLPKTALDRVKLHVFTTYVSAEHGGKRPTGMNRKLYQDYVERTEAALGNVGLKEQVVLHPSLPYLDFLGVLDQFDYLIVNDAKSGRHHAVNPYLPSKYGDYKGASSLIWALCENGSCLDASDSHVKTPLGDANAVRSVLMKELATRGYVDC